MGARQLAVAVRGAALGALLLAGAACTGPDAGSVAVDAPAVAGGTSPAPVEAAGAAVDGPIAPAGEAADERPGEPPTVDAASPSGTQAAAPGAEDEPAPAGGGLTPGAPVRLTDGGCCTQPFWRADGAGLWFIDRPDGGETGYFEARLDAPGAPPTLVTTTIASFSPDQTWRIDRAPGRTTLVRLADGAAFDVPAGGRTVAFAPDGARIAWQLDIEGAPPERNVATIVVGTPDGAERREVARLTRGALAGWLDDATLLARGRETAQADEDILWAYPLDGGERREIARGRRLRGQALSPGGRWLAWYVAGDPEPAANGLWLVETRAGAAPPRRLEGYFGAYQWRDGQRLVIVPFEPGAAGQRLIELDVASGAERPLIDPDATSLRIANGDWTLSPDGRHMAFVSAEDHNIWALRLPD